MLGATWGIFWGRLGDLREPKRNVKVSIRSHSGFERIAATCYRSDHSTLFPDVGYRAMFGDGQHQCITKQSGSGATEHDGCGAGASKATRGEEAAESAAGSRAIIELSSLRVAWDTYKRCEALQGTDGTQNDAELRQSLRERVEAELRRQQEEESAPGPGLPYLTAGLTRLAAELLKEDSVPNSTAEREVLLPAKTPEVAPGESVPGFTAEKKVLSPAEAPEESAPVLTADTEVLLPAKPKYPPAEAQSAPGSTVDKEVLLPAKPKYPPAEAKHAPAKAKHALQMCAMPKGGYIQPNALPKVMPKAR